MADTPLLTPAATPSPAGPSTPEAGVPEAPGAEAPAAPPSFIDKHLSQSQARFDAVAKEVHRIAGIRKGLDALGRMGDAVTSDDVLDEMADLVAHGADPKMFAAIIAGNSEAGIGPMPPQGEALAGWLGRISSEFLTPYEAQLKPAKALAQHQLGVAALHKMVDLHSKAGAAPAPAEPLGGPAAPAAPTLLQ